MTPLVLYTASLQPNLLVGYTDFKSELAVWLGYGFDSSQWPSDESAELNRSIQEAYRWILYPQTIPGGSTPHTWSFMEQTTTIVTTADDYDYTLPADFGSFIGQYMYWGVGVVYDHVCRTNDTDIINCRAFSERTARPEKFALRWAGHAFRNSCWKRAKPSAKPRKTDSAATSGTYSWTPCAAPSNLIAEPTRRPRWA